MILVRPMDESAAISLGRERVHPVVLAGGASRRFGCDKLRVVWRGRALVQWPIATLREVFGHRVVLVGNCHPGLAVMADGVTSDIHPGVGPIGGIVSALSACGTAVFVLAGDMPAFTAAGVKQIVSAAGEHPHALAVVAKTDRLHPCAGFYRPGALGPLSDRIRRGQLSLSDAVAAMPHGEVPCEPAWLLNVNTPRDLPLPTSNKER